MLSLDGLPPDKVEEIRQLVARWKMEERPSTNDDISAPDTGDGDGR